MHNVINLNQYNKWVQAGFLGKIVKMEAYASKQMSDIDIILRKKVSYKKEVGAYVDTIPAEGTTVTSAKNYALPLTYTNVDGTSGEIVETEVDVSQGGLKLYATLDDGAINGFRNGYWDLTFQDNALGSDPEKRDWTLTNFKYVDGVKTTVIQFTGSTARATTPDTLTLRHTTSFDKYDEIELTLTATEETIADVYCSGSDYTILRWDDVVQPQEFTIASLSISKDSFVFLEPKDDTSGLPYYICDGDIITFNTTTDNINAMQVLIYVES